MIFSLLFTFFSFPFYDAFSYPTNPERFVVKCEIRNYLRDFKGIYRPLTNADYVHYLNQLWMEYNESEIHDIMQRYDC